MTADDEDHRRRRLRSPAAGASQSPELSQEEKLLTPPSPASELLTARHGAAYTLEQYDAGLDTSAPPPAAPIENLAVTRPRRDIMLKSPSEPRAGARPAQGVQARTTRERARDGEAKNAELLEMLTTAADGVSIARRPAGPKSVRSLPRRPADSRGGGEGGGGGGRGGGKRRRTTGRRYRHADVQVRGARERGEDNSASRPNHRRRSLRIRSVFAPAQRPPRPRPVWRATRVLPPTAAAAAVPRRVAGTLHASGARRPRRSQPLSPSVDAWLEDDPRGDARARSSERDEGGDEGVVGGKKPPRLGGRDDAPREPARDGGSPPSYFGRAAAGTAGPPGVVPVRGCCRLRRRRRRRRPAEAGHPEGPAQGRRGHPAGAR